MHSNHRKTHNLDLRFFAPFPQVERGASNKIGLGPQNLKFATRLKENFSLPLSNMLKDCREHVHESGKERLRRQIHDFFRIYSTLKSNFQPNFPRHIPHDSSIWALIVTLVQDLLKRPKSSQRHLHIHYNKVKFCIAS